MGETITLDVKLRAFVRKQKKNLWIAVCPTLGVASQGDDRADAMASLKEAVAGWFESCLARGVLDQAMREANWRPLGHGERVLVDAERVLTNTTIQDDEDDVLGDLFPISIEIPAYQAAAFMSASM